MALIFEQSQPTKQASTDYLCINFEETLSDISVLAQKFRAE
jgi:hypothetical protein